VILAIALSSLIGVALGLLGGGGSILTVPVLHYALGLDAKSAIATSLLVVGITSTVAALAHARRGRVLWRTAAVFGAAAMAGAYAGGFLASWIPGELLLVGFAGVMLASALALFRARDASDTARRPERLGRLALEGASVGVVTGMVGAGGGFLVVPALVVLGGLPMSLAIGTSLVVVALKSFAGLAGYLGHVAIDWPLALLVSSAAVVGSLSGARLSARVSPAVLRQGFAWFVLVMAALILFRELPAGVRESALFQAVFVARWPFWVGGTALAGFVMLLLWSENRLLGVSTGYAELCQVRRQPPVRRSWRLPFLGGIVLGGLIAALASGAQLTFALGQFDSLVTSSVAGKLAVLLVAGALIGWGARTAGGCTSGHSIVGTALGSRASLLATGAFLAGGFLTTQLIVRFL
jgi:hypothetical protein